MRNAGRLLPVAVALILLPGLQAQTLLPDGSPTLVNTHRPERQTGGQVAIAADGRSLVVWFSFRQDPDGSFGVYGQFFDAAGAMDGPEFVVSAAAGDQIPGNVVFDGSVSTEPRFLVSWADRATGTAYVSRYNATTRALIDTIVLNDSSSASGVVRLGVAANGDFVASWNATPSAGGSVQVFFRRFDATGTAKSAEVQVTTFPATSFSRISTIGVAASGDFTISWNRHTPGAADAIDLFAQAYDASGVAKAAPVQVTAPGVTLDINHRIAMGMASRTFAVVWEGISGSNSDVYLQRFDAGGALVGGAMRLHTETGGRQGGPEIAADPDGNFIVAWFDRPGATPAPATLTVRAVDSKGNLRSPEYKQPNPDNTIQGPGSVAFASDGSFRVAYSERTGDVTLTDVFVQKFKTFDWGSTDPDVAISKWGLPPRPGFDQVMYIQVHNNGVASARDVVVEDTLDTKVTFVSADPAPFESNGVIKWDLGTVRGRSSVTIKLTVKVASTVALGTEICDRATVRTTSAGDLSENNTTKFCSKAVGSFDPNMKAVSPEDRFIAPGQILTYFIHFENKGTLPTVKITVTDVLDTDLDDARLAFISDGGVYNSTSRTIKWELDIALPPGGTGFVTFRIAAKEGLAPGTEIRDAASIVFDFNPPIVTDPVIQIIGTPEELRVQGADNELVRLRLDVSRSGSTVARSLVAKLDQAIARAREALALRQKAREELAANRLEAARNTLSAFLNEVRAQEGRHVLSSQAVDWIERGENILETLK